MMDKKKKWHDAMVAKGHVPIMEEYSDGPVLDVFVVDCGFHNGPGCSKCRWSTCYHCDGVEDIPECR